MELWCMLHFYSYEQETRSFLESEAGLKVRKSEESEMNFKPVPWAMRIGLARNTNPSLSLVTGKWHTLAQCIYLCVEVIICEMMGSCQYVYDL
jgi:hypothetical protein